jgi:hypothetical protein
VGFFKEKEEEEEEEEEEEGKGRLIVSRPSASGFLGNAQLCVWETKNNLDYLNLR